MGGMIGDRWTVGLVDLGGLFQPWWFCVFYKQNGQRRDLVAYYL